MSLNKSTGDMYSFCTHTWNPLNGECPHGCEYCYVKNTPAGRQGFYSGKLRLNKNAMSDQLGSGRTIFVCSLNDLFAAEVPGRMIELVMEKINIWSENTYLFQTKNPAGFLKYLEWFPGKSLLGTTIESTGPWNSIVGNGAPYPPERIDAMKQLPATIRKFLTLEPIMEFELDEMAEWIEYVQPEFVAIGADSKGHTLPEPSAEKVKALIGRLNRIGIEVRQKSNLGRLLA